MEIKKDSVSILMPSLGNVSPKVAASLTALAVTSCKQGYPISQVCVMERTLIHTARNTLASNFLKSDCEWAFWMDDDMILESRTIPYMINMAKQLNQKFLTGIYYQRVTPHRPLAMIRPEEAKKSGSCLHWHVNIDYKQPVKLDACGFGCVLTHRDIFDKLDWPYFKYKTGEHDVSEDFYFCMEAQKKGIELWALPDLECIHMGEPVLVTREMYKEKPDSKIELTAAKVGKEQK